MTFSVQISIHILKKLLSEIPSIGKTLFSEKKIIIIKKKKANVWEGVLQS
jgi:hypothetical protein